MSDVEPRAFLGREFSLAAGLSSARACASDLEVALNYARDISRENGLDSDLDPHLDFARDLFAILGHPPRLEVIGLHDRVFALADAIDIVRTSAEENALTEAYLHDWPLDLARVRDLDSTLTDASRRARELAVILTRTRDPDSGNGESHARRVVRPAAGLLAAAARFLPAADRARYAEEYRSELWELAGARQPRRRQIGYAVRQAASSLRLSAELRAPRRRKASP